jgi:general secretion pathway protein G
MLKTLERVREARKNESGFTLIELLIVIVILGVLAGIVVFAVGAFNNDGKAAACKADVKNVEIAQEAHLAKSGAYAGSVDQLVGSKFLREAPTSAEGISTDTGGQVAHTCSTS